MGWTGRIAFVAATLFGAVAVACGPRSDAPASDGYAQLLPFDTARIRLISARDTATLTVELAENDAQRTMGLMERRALPADAGMLFLYPAVQSDSSAFWMFRTRLPLDIAFIDSTGTIRTVLTMPPCASPLAEGCPDYPARARYLAALEVNAGYFSRNRFQVGDRVLLADTATRRPASPPPT